MGTISQLVGFENSDEDGLEPSFNFILSNGTRSTQKDVDYPTKYTHMIPADAINRISRVIIHYY